MAHASSKKKKNAPTKSAVKSAPPKKASAPPRNVKPSAKSEVKASAPAPEAPPEEKRRGRKPFTAEDAEKMLTANQQLRRLITVGTNRDSFRTGTKSGSKRLPEQYDVFFKVLSETANASKACIAANLSRDHVYDIKRNDKAFAKRWEDAMELGWLVMEEEAQRRAFEGTEKPVYKGGLLVDVVRECSDTLAMFLLRGRNRKVFGDRKEVTVNNGNAPYSILSDDELDDFIQSQVDLKVEK